MLTFLSKFFLKKSIFLYAPLPLSACRLQKPYLLERAGISDGTAILMAIPYFTKECLKEDRNVSCYAVSRDYHGFFQELYDELIPQLQTAFPQNKFAGFADHSPVGEVEAAALAGLGMIGKNHLLITKPYASYVFLGTLVTDAVLPCEIHPIEHCADCGRCISACPASSPSDCLSAITQKKGKLSDAETETILKHGSAWGCDICQLICPHTQKAIQDQTIFTPIPYFFEKSISNLTLDVLDRMSDAEFSERAYAWRGRDTIRRNLLLLQSDVTKGE